MVKTEQLLWYAGKFMCMRDKICSAVAKFVVIKVCNVFSDLYRMHPVHKVLHILVCVRACAVCCGCRCVIVDLFMKREFTQEKKLTLNP